jgi:hypothetical protein
MKYLSIFKDVDKIKSYAWGAASWANLIDSLKKPDASNIVGCTMALMVTYSAFFFPTFFHFLTF